MSYWRVSDLNGPTMVFPNFQTFSKLTDIDLSFNQLNGTIPGNLKDLPKLEVMYLTNNSLTGEVPSWISHSKHNFFGVVALEIVSGKSNTNYRPKEAFVYLLDWAYVLHEQGNLLDLVDPILEKYSKKEALRMLNIALLCTNSSPTLRPSMSAVVSMLDGKIPVQAPLVNRHLEGDEARFRAFEQLSQDSQTQSHSMEGPIEGLRIDSSVSLASKDKSREESSEARHLPDLYNIDISSNA
ncbi:hypothetical protein GIB67_026970 [Kingdonia uniflora]|uniref:Uncharacterized protein n=1 Tax=Kingdonia uniflora TaxID=39325 RepID=A0A7J7P1G9_9MAGN|nr:hypothetical protein GIB67_026970 [Kingdonia uniflora]